MSVLTRPRCSAAALLLAATALASSPASADTIGGGSANIKSMSFDAQSVNTTLHVISTDGQKWDKLKSGNIQFWGHMKLDTRWPGYTYEVGVVLGACGGGLCLSFPSIFFDQPGSRDYNHQTNFSIDTADIPVSTSGIALLPYGDSIIARCNDHLQPDGPTKSHSFTYEMYATFIADTGGYINNTDNIIYQATFGPGPHKPEHVDHSRKDSFEIQVVCDPVIKPPTNDLSFDHGDFDVEDVKLFLTTVNTLNPTGGNPGTLCPVLRVTARAETNQEGPVTMRIWEQLNGGPITSKVKQAWASYDAAKNGYFATYQEHRNFGVTTHAQYRVEIIDNSFFPPFDGWKDITIHCTGAGGGGLATTPPTDPDLPQPQAAWEGQITVLDTASADRSCPRKGRAFFAVSRKGPGNFKYRISCSNGAFFTDTATGHYQGESTWKAVGLHEFNVTKTRSIQCTLQELKANGTPVTVDLDDKDFACANPTFDPVTNDITVTPRPQPQKPKVPAVIVDPAPKCSPGLKLINGRCVRKPVIVDACKRDETLIRGKCVKKPGVSILCKPGFDLKQGKCVRKPVIVTRCKPGEQLVRGKCVRKPDISILCKPGYELKGDKCVKKPVIVVRCKPNEQLLRGHCVPKPVYPPKRLVAPKRVTPNASATRSVKPLLLRRTDRSR